MKKRTIRLVSLLVSIIMLITAITACTPDSSETETEAARAENDPDVLVWETGLSSEYAQVVQEAVNGYLSDKGAGYTVKILSDVGSPSETESRIEKITNLHKNGQQIDLITCQSAVLSRSYEMLTYDDMYLEASKEVLMPLNDFLKSEDGVKVSDCLTERDLEKNEIYGTIYGLPVGSSVIYRAFSYNKVLLDKYDIDIEDLSDNIFENIDIIKTIYEGETAELPDDEKEKFAGVAYNESLYDNLGMPSLLQLVCDFIMLDDNGKFISAFETERFRELAENTKELNELGLLYFARDRGDFNNFVAASQMVYTDEIYESVQYVYKDNETLDEIETVVIPNLDEPIGEAMSGTTTVGITNWSANKENALDFLTRLFSDSELANIVRYGVEGEDYVVTEDGFAELTPESRTDFGANTNLYLIYPQEDNEIYSRDEITEFRGRYDSYFPYGFRFDYSPVKTEVDAVRVAVYGGLKGYSPEYEDLITGRVDDVDAAIDKLNSDLKAAGIDRIIEEANRQLEEWRKNKE